MLKLTFDIFLILALIFIGVVIVFVTIITIIIGTKYTIYIWRKKI